MVGKGLGEDLGDAAQPVDGAGHLLLCLPEGSGALSGAGTQGEGLLHPSGHLIHDTGGLTGQGGNLPVAVRGVQIGDGLEGGTHRPHDGHRPLGEALVPGVEQPVALQIFGERVKDQLHIELVGNGFYLRIQRLVLCQVFLRGSLRLGDLALRGRRGGLCLLRRGGALRRRSGGTAGQQRCKQYRRQDRFYRGHLASGGSFPKTAVRESSTSQLSPSQ